MKYGRVWENITKKSTKKLEKEIQKPLHGGREIGNITLKQCKSI